MVTVARSITRVSSKTNCLKAWWLRLLAAVPVASELPIPGSFVEFSMRMPGRAMNHAAFQTVVVVAEDGSTFNLAPGYSGRQYYMRIRTCWSGNPACNG